MKPGALSFWSWIAIWIKVIGQIGIRAALRGARNQLEDKLASRGERFVLRLSRAWYVLGACAGLAMIAAARPPRMAAEGVDVGSVAIFAAVTGVGVGVALRSAAMFMATYSTTCDQKPGP